MLVRLEHMTLVLYVQRVEKKAAADTRVVLAYPNRSGESEYVRAEKPALSSRFPSSVFGERRS